MKAKISLIKCDNYQPQRVQEAFSRAIGLLGGMSNFIRPGSRVLVKPNLLLAKEPEFGITTHPEVVRAVIKLLKEINCKITVGDSPSVFGREIENVGEVYARTGIKKVCDDEGVRLAEFNKRRIRRGIPLTAMLDECEHIVNIAKFKTHNMTLLTAAIKNLFGLVVGTYKTEVHKNYFKPEDFAKILVDIYQEAHPALTIVDAVVAMEGDGPGTTGKLRKTNLLLAGADCAALDSILAQIMGIRPLDILTTKEAVSRGLGVADNSAIEILGEKIEDVTGEPFLLPATSIKTRFIPKPVINLLFKLIKHRPYCLHNKCIRCRACIKACPKKCISLRNNRIVFYYRDCIACFCCQEVCPQAAIRVKKSLLAKLAGL